MTRCDDHDCRQPVTRESEASFDPCDPDNVPPPLPDELPCETGAEHTSPAPAYPPLPPMAPPPVPASAAPDRQNEAQGSVADNLPGLLGFIFSMCAISFAPIFMFSICFWITGIVLSCIGLGRRPRGFAVAGMCLAALLLLIAVGCLLIFAAGMEAQFDRL